MNYVFKKIFRFFDKLEDHVRIALSHYPIVYTIIGGFSIVLFWRGVWMTADYFPFLTGPIGRGWPGPSSPGWLRKPARWDRHGRALRPTK